MTNPRLIGAVLALTSQALASDLTYNLNFSTLGQAMFGSGSSQTADKTYLAGATWDKSDSAGGIDNTLGVRDGAKLSASTSGEAGVKFQFQMDSGTVNAAFPANLKLTVPDTVRPGDRFIVQSALDLLPGTLSTHFPGFGIGGSLDLQMDASAKLEICVLDSCGGGSLDAGLAINTGMFSYNLNGDNKLQVFGVNVPVVNFGDVINLPLIGAKLGDLEIDNPNLTLHGDETTISIPHFGPDGFEITTENGLLAEGKVDMLTLHADALNYGAVAVDLGIPSPVFSVGVQVCDLPGCSIRMDLAEVNVGIALGVSQTFFIEDPEMEVSLTLRETGETHRFAGTGGVRFTAPTTEFTELHIDPVFTLHGPNGDLTFSNNTFLTAVPDLDINALKACAASFCLGPVFDYHRQLDAGLLQIPLVQNTFDLNLPSIRGDALIIGNSNAPVESPASAPEPGSLILVGIGVGLVACRRFMRRTNSHPEKIRL